MSAIATTISLAPTMSAKTGSAPTTSNQETLHFGSVLHAQLNLVRNPFRFCDSNLNERAWTNASTSVSCEDNPYCNGNDSCESGNCRHQFTGNRCTQSGRVLGHPVTR
jgi:hypothetical protein